MGCKVGVLEPAFSDYSRAFSGLPCSLERIFLEPDLWDRPATVLARKTEVVTEAIERLIRRAPGRQVEGEP